MGGSQKEEMGSLRGREVWAIPPCLHRCGECGKKFIKPLMKGDLTAASISSLKLGPPSPSAKKATGTLDVLTDWMGEDEWGKQRTPKGLPRLRGCREMGGEKREQEADQGPTPACRAGGISHRGRGHFPRRAGGVSHSPAEMPAEGL